MYNSENSMFLGFVFSMRKVVPGVMGDHRHHSSLGYTVPLFLNSVEMCSQMSVGYVCKFIRDTKGDSGYRIAPGGP